MRVLALVMLSVLAGSAAAAPAAPAAQPTEAQKQEYFVRKALQTPLHMMTPAQVDYYLKNVDPGTLPQDLKKAYQGRRQDIHEAGLDIPPKPVKEMPQPLGKKHPKSKVDLNDPESLLKAGYEELEKREVRWLSKETLCTETKLVEFSTLRIVPGISKKKKSSFRYFIHGKDPLFATVAGYRKGQKEIGGTRFFGSQKHSYCKK